MDRGFLDFGRLHALHRAQAFFVIHAKSNLQYQRRYSHPIDKASGLRCDQPGVLTGVPSCTDYSSPIRRIKFYDAKHDKLLVFLTTHFDLPALTITELYRCRWPVELFFQWIKQHLRINAFFGTSENAVTTSGLDRYCGLWAGSPGQKTSDQRCLALYDATNSEFDAFRANAARSTACPH